MTKKVKILAVFGTRPEAVKMAPVIRELQSRGSLAETVVCVTAQHREMLDQVLHAFSLVPDYDLNLMRPGQTLSDLTAGVLNGLEEIIRLEKPDLVLVHGDTTTTFAAALAAYYHQVPVGHVEAGLRTNCKYSPFPEEVNRQFVSLVADLNFAPTERSRQNLLRENRSPESIIVTGNTAIDALKTTVRPSYRHELLDWAAGSRLILLTAHRRENFGDPMRSIFRAVLRVLEKHPDVRVIYPVHRNPAVLPVAREIFGGCSRVKLTDPLDVVDFHNIMNAACIILTDSGGIQEEAPSLGKPVLVLRSLTERTEGIAAGTLKLAGTDENAVFTMTDRLLSDPEEYRRMSTAGNPYGDGFASRRIADAILAWFGARGK
jgi:UDP-N-acetylglucosamine 2-epimerase (non-hydrolysing)